MRVVIVGCGRVGALLATILSTDGHNVAIIDRNAATFKRLPSSFRGTPIEGNAFDQDVLKRAGIQMADAFASVTAGDNTNYVLAAMARNRFKVPRVVTRIYDPLRADIYRRLGVPTISTTVWGANKIWELLTYTGLTSVVTVANGEVEVVEAEISPLIAGVAVKDITIPGETQVVAVVRGGTAFIPSSMTKFVKGDRVLVAVLATALPRLESMLSPR
ncbi:MAG: TrkA family potassium uptake protein [Chloroflexi bacterium]|nr:TrkA family potassium uptake protein [Chloroflexota bacterium]MCL5074527.1 TrkA family potassium uptake protein [Chloroflexota bacterium]